jgi:hypothetical protein
MSETGLVICNAECNEKQCAHLRAHEEREWEESILCTERETCYWEELSAKCIPVEEESDET